MRSSVAVKKARTSCGHVPAGARQAACARRSGADCIVVQPLGMQRGLAGCLQR
jgi:hypothetical protein